MSNYIDRLLAEQSNIKKDRKYMFFARSTKDILTWECGFPGPNIPLYRNSYYIVSMKFPKNYPYSPPNVKFVKKVFHPNVYCDGSVCLSLLSYDWKPSITINNILCGLQRLLMTPNPNSPANGPAASAYRTLDKYKCEVRRNIDKYHSKVPWA